jgi:hypothetical protein
MKFGSLTFNPAVLGMIATLVRGHRSSVREEWPTQRLAGWHEARPRRGVSLRFEFRHLSQAFKAYKIAVANSEPAAWCRCRYGETHEIEFWFAAERDRTRVAMLLQLHGLGSVCGERP